MPRKRSDNNVVTKPQIKRRKSVSSLSKKLNLIRSELCLFDEPPFDVSLVNSFFVEHYPLNTVSDRSSPITFYVQGGDQHYIDLRECRLYVRGKIVKGDGKSLSNTDIIAPVNNFLHSMFSQCTVWLNETQITPPNMYYGFRAYIDMLLGYGKEYKKSQAQCNFYFREKDVNNTDHTKEDGFKQRFERIKESKTFELYGRPHLDIFLQNRFMIPGIDLRLQFERASDDFCLFGPSNKSDQKFRVDLEEVVFYVKKHQVLPSIALTNLQQWEAGSPFAYPMKKVEVKTFSVATGILSMYKK